MPTISPTERADLIEGILTGAESFTTSEVFSQLQDLDDIDAGSRSSVTRTLNNMAEHDILERHENGQGYVWSIPEEEEEDPFTKMETKHLVRSYVQDYGKGFSYECYRNGESVGSMTDLLRDNNPDLGDEIKLKVYTTGRVKYYVKEVEFVIENTEEAWDRIEAMKSRRKQRGKVGGPRDYQKQKLYDWEKSYLDFWGEKFEGDTKEEQAVNAGEYAQDIVDQLGFDEQVNVNLNKRRSRWSVWKNGYNTIDVAPNHLSKALIIHELAHGVIEWVGLKNRVAAHGPAFVRIFIEMLATFYDQDREEMIQDARERGDLDVLDEVLPIDELIAEKESNQVLSEETVERFTK